MRYLLLGAVAFGVMTLPAQAYTITQYERSATLPNTYAPSALSFTSGYEQGITANSAVATSPFSGTTYFGRAYDTVLANGSATFAASSFGQSNGALGTFAFVFGSPDTYNELTFTENGATVLTLTGSDFGATPRSGYYLTSISDIGSFDSVTFTTGSTNGLEFAAVSPVPLPASAPMLGAALLAFGALGYGVKRKKAAAAA